LLRELSPAHEQRLPTNGIVKSADKLVEFDPLAERPSGPVHPRSFDGHVARTSDVDADDERRPRFRDVDEDRAEVTDGTNRLRGSQLAEKRFSTPLGGGRAAASSRGFA
jgi:hypothetical protein